MYANRFDSTPEEVHAYVQSLLALVGDRDPLDILSETSGEVFEHTRKLDAEALTRAEAEGKWSVAQLVAHLADAEIVYAFRYRMILGHDNPALAGYDQDAWASRMHYESIPLEESMALFAVTRRSNVRLLRSLTGEERQRAAQHEERGRETLERLSYLHAGHDLVHLRQLARVIASVAP